MESVYCSFSVSVRGILQKVVFLTCHWWMVKHRSHWLRCQCLKMQPSTSAINSARCGNFFQCILVVENMGISIQFTHLTYYSNYSHLIFCYTQYYDPSLTLANFKKGGFLVCILKYRSMFNFSYSLKFYA